MKVLVLVRMLLVVCTCCWFVLRIIECVRCHDIGMSCNVSSRCKFPVPVPFPLYSRSYLFVCVPVYPGPRLVFDSFRPAPVFGEKNMAMEMGEEFSRPFPSVFILGTLPFWLHRLSCEYLLIILVLLWRPWRRVLVVVASCPGTVLLVHSRAVCRRTDCLASHIILS